MSPRLQLQGNCQLVLHQGANALINSTDTIANELHLQTISNVEILTCSIVIMPTKMTGTCKCTMCRLGPSL